MNYRTRKIIYDFILERLSIITIIIIALSSCHKIPLTYNEQISLSAEVLGEDEPTKGGLIDNDTKIKGVGFKVSAYNCATNWATNGSGATPNIMSNQEVNWTDPNWTYTPLALWPSSGKVSFFAFSPNSTTITMSILAGTPTITYTTPPAAENQVDLLTSQQMDKTYADGKVKFSFKHSLACIGFQAKRHPNSADTKIVITKLDVKYTDNKVISENKFTFNTTDNSGGTWGTATATFTGGKISENIQKSNSIELTDALQIINADNKYLMLIPQSLVAGDLQVVVTYRVNNFTTDITKTVNLPATTLGMGNRYLFNLLVSGDKIEYGTMNITGWNNNPITVEERVLLHEYNTLSNCYMVSPDADKKTILKFPAVARVNQFWAEGAGGGRVGDSDGINTLNPTGTGGGTSGNGDGRVASGNANNAITSLTQWYAEIIWADFDPAGKVTIKQGSSSPGTGIYEKLEIILNNGTYSGNMVVGLKKSGGGDYLWSWHIWITNYKPNSDYILMNVGTNPVSNAHKVMNRNLGATFLEGRGLYYQWGRKDPFVAPAITPTYPTGVITTSTTVADATLVSIVNNPTLFYSAHLTIFWPFYNAADPVNSGFLSGNNTNTNEGGHNRWGGSTGRNTVVATENYKTIYDPCPSGWRIPWGTNWAGINKDTPATNFTWQSAPNPTGRIYKLYGQNNLFRTGGWIINTTSSGLPKSDETYIDAEGYYWSGSPYSTTTNNNENRYSVLLFYKDGFINGGVDPCTRPRHWGCSIRCVEDK